MAETCSEAPKVEVSLEGLLNQARRGSLKRSRTKYPSTTPARCSGSPFSSPEESPAARLQRGSR